MLPLVFMDGDRRSNLEALLISLFDESSLRQWLIAGPDGQTVCHSIPGPPIALRELVHRTTDVLSRAGLVGIGLFERLLRDFPHRGADIRHALATWTCEQANLNGPEPVVVDARLQELGARLPAATSAPLPAGFDLARHIERLLPEVDHINITGIRPRPGASRDALRRPIETLYTPLRSPRPRISRDDLRRPIKTLERPFRRHRPRFSVDDDTEIYYPESDHVELPELLRSCHRLLLEGQPGSGKTTFLNLVACMLARDLAPGHPKPRDANSWRARYLGLDGPTRIPGVVRVARLIPLLTQHPNDARGDEHRWLLHLLALRSCPEEQLELDIRDPGHQRRCTEWDELLRTGQAWLLLDGLDEIADEGLRERIFTIFRVACARWQSSRILVTSRPIKTEALLGMGFSRSTIASFKPKQIKEFVDLWSAALHEDRAPEASAEKSHALLRAIEKRPELLELAENPVMLTCLCVVHWNEGGLPEGRARVYHAVLHWMLCSRDELRAAHGYTSEFAEYAFPSLALAMMIGPEGKRASIDLWEAAEVLNADVARVVPDEPDPRRWARTWLRRECEWSHIVEEIEGDELKFWHLTMQEYAAARAFAQRDDDDWWPQVRERLDDLQWRKTLEFLPGCLYDEGGRRRVDGFLARVLDEAGTTALRPAAQVVCLLGQLLPTLRAYKYPLKPEIAAHLKDVQRRTLAIFTREGAVWLPMRVRVEVAEALAASGFPRPEGDFLPLPGKNLSLGKYPVTVAEFAEFVKAGGYADNTNWDTGGRRLRGVRGWTEPGSWDSQQEHPNRPVVWVSWCEARAYCLWLGRRLGLTVRLPTFTERKFAASPDGRTYPWGNEAPGEEVANFMEYVGTATPVGVYPSGAGPFGHQDLAGNVWEWCEDGAVEPEQGQRQRWGDRHWVTGGSWGTGNNAMAATTCEWCLAGDRNGMFGFRIAAETTSH